MTRWVRFAQGNAEGFGTLEGEVITVHAGDLFAAPIATGEILQRTAIRLLAPVRPGKFIGLWNNSHAVAKAREVTAPDFPLYFLKAGSAILGPDDAFRSPPHYTGRIVFEGELGVVIGTRCKDVSEGEAAGAIFGYTCVNDITAVELFGEYPGFEQWARAKGCDGFGPVGPAIATGLDWRELRVRTLLNGRERQNFATSDYVLSPPQIVSLLSREMTLEPGDLITCGTSTGVLPMRPGATVEVLIDGVGSLRTDFAA